MQLPAASQSFSSWQRDGRGAFSYGKKLPARPRICGPPLASNARLQHPTLEAELDLLVTSSLLPPIRCHMAYRVSPFINATGALSALRRSRSKTVFGYRGVSCQQPSPGTSWASPRSTPATVAFSVQ